MKTLDSVGEDSLVDLLVKKAPLGKNVLIGPGDDCAVIHSPHPESSIFQLLKTDSVIEGRHFLRSMPAHKVGWKSAARVVSDFAAMGGWPDSLMVAIAVPKELPISYIRELYKGIYCCAEQYNFSIVGGETSCHEHIIITISGIGFTHSPIPRSGAKEGEQIYVTGKLGNSFASKHLNFTPRLKEAKWISENLRPSSMMDLSDGLAIDLPRLAKCSKIGYQLNDHNIPLSDGANLYQALNDGEDYELLFTSSTDLSDSLANAWKLEFPDVPLTAIGAVTKESKNPLEGGWDHFTSRPFAG